MGEFFSASSCHRDPDLLGEAISSIANFQAFPSQKLAFLAEQRAKIER